MLEVLFPNISQPLQGNYSIKSSKVNKYLAANNLSGNPFPNQERFLLPSKEIIKGDAYMKKTITVNKDKFSMAYSFDLAYDENVPVVLDFFENLKSIKSP